MQAHRKNDPAGVALPAKARIKGAVRAAKAACKDHLIELSTDSLEWQQATALHLCLLAELDRICRRHTLRYYVIYDSLLGAVRQKALIRNSPEISVALPRTDYHHLLELLSVPDENRRYYLETSEDARGLFASRISCRNSRIRFRNALPMQNAGSGIGLYLYPIDKALSDAAAEARRLRSIICCNGALLDKAGRRRRCTRDQRNAYIRMAGSAGIGPMRMAIQSFLPALVLERMIDRALLNPRNPMDENSDVIYLPYAGLGAASYFPERLLNPPTQLPINGHSYSAPGRPHELLTLLYDQYREREIDRPATLLLNDFYIDTIYWADVLSNEDPSGLL